MPTIIGTMSMAKSVLELLGYIRNIAGANVISAYFKYDGLRIEGSERIEIERHEEGDKTVFWYSIKAISNYAFMRFPTVGSSAYELIGTVRGESLPDARYWRWVSPPEPGVIVGGNSEFPNLKTDFVVVGYRTKALLDHFSTKG